MKNAVFILLAMTLVSCGSTKEKEGLRSND